MILKCPNCLTRYRVNTARVSKIIVKVRCPSCTKSVIINLKRMEQTASDYDTNPKPLSTSDVMSTTSVRRLRNALSVMVDGELQTPFVLVADEPRAFRNFLRKSLEELGCRVVTVDDGASVEEYLQRGEKPHVLFLNVVLKHVMGYVLCEKIKADSRYQDIRIVLIGAIFRIDRFRRDPSSFYGADDYIEEIIVKQDLQERIKKLLGLPVEGEKETAMQLDVIEHARRLARIILSDIVLYNQSRVDQLIREDTFRSELSGEIEEGEQYFLEKIPSDRPEIPQIYRQTIDDYLRRRKRELSEKES